MIVQGPGLLRVPGMCFAHSSSQQIRTLRLNAYVDNLTLERMLVYILQRSLDCSSVSSTLPLLCCGLQSRRSLDKDSGSLDT